MFIKLKFRFSKNKNKVTFLQVTHFEQKMFKYIRLTDFNHRSSLDCGFHIFNLLYFI